MAAIPNGHNETHTSTSSATPNTVRIDNVGPTDATPWPFVKPLTLKEQKQKTMQYFKSFRKKR